MDILWNIADVSNFFVISWVNLGRARLCTKPWIFTGKYQELAVETTII